MSHSSLIGTPSPTPHEWDMACSDCGEQEITDRGHDMYANGYASTVSHNVTGTAYA